MFFLFFSSRKDTSLSACEHWQQTTQTVQYLDFLLYEESQYEWSGGRYEGTPKTVFKKILPCIDLDDVHYCDYTWYDGVEAPECY